MLQYLCTSLEGVRDGALENKQKRGCKQLFCILPKLPALLNKFNETRYNGLASLSLRLTGAVSTPAVPPTLAGILETSQSGTRWTCQVTFLGKEFGLSLGSITHFKGPGSGSAGEAHYHPSSGRRQGSGFCPLKVGNEINWEYNCNCFPSSQLQFNIHKYIQVEQSIILKHVHIADHIAYSLQEK